MTNHIRLAVCGTALVAGFWYFTSAAAAPPTLPKDTHKNVIEADIAKMKELLNFIAGNPKDFNAKAAAWTVKTLAFTTVMNAEATGDAALRDQAMKVIAASMKLSEVTKPRSTMRVVKDVVDSAKEVAALVEKMSPKPGSAPLKSTQPYKDKKYEFDLWQAMTPMRPGDRGGTNIEKDIREMVKKNGDKKPIPADVEIIAARSANIGEFALAFPNDKAMTNAANKKAWDKLSQDMMDISKKLAEEARKPKASEQELVKLLNSLNDNCYKCHSEFRDE